MKIAPLILKDTVILVIDVQEEMCDPKHPRGLGNKSTVKIAERIASIVPQFRKAGVPVYAVYLDEDEDKIRTEDIGFYKFKPDPKDTLIGKSDFSAFKSSHIDAILRKAKKKTLLVCGFNRSACVLESVYDSCANLFDVRVMKDLTGNGNSQLGQDVSADFYLMKQRGAKITTSAAMLRQIKKAALHG